MMLTELGIAPKLYGLPEMEIAPANVTVGHLSLIRTLST